VLHGWSTRLSSSRRFLDIYPRRAGEQVQLDELFALLSAVQGQGGQRGRGDRALERFPTVVWVAMDPESKLLLGSTSWIVRWRWPSALSTRWRSVGADCAPLFLTDGFRSTHGLGSRTMGTGCGRPPPGPRPAPKPRWMPCLGCSYAQVVKTVRRRRLVRVRHRSCLAPWRRCSRCGGLRLADQTAFVERINLAIASMWRRGAACQYAVQGRGGLAAAVDAVSCLL